MGMTGQAEPVGSSSVSGADSNKARALAIAAESTFAAWPLAVRNWYSLVRTEPGQQDLKSSRCWEMQAKTAYVCSSGGSIAGAWSGGAAAALFASVEQSASEAPSLAAIRAVEPTAPLCHQHSTAVTVHSLK